MPEAGAGSGEPPAWDRTRSLSTVASSQGHPERTPRCVDYLTRKDVYLALDLYAPPLPCAPLHSGPAGELSFVGPQDGPICHSDMQMKCIHRARVISVLSAAVAHSGRGRFRGDNCVFQFGAEIFPTKVFCAISGTSCSCCLLSGGGSEVLLRCCRQSVYSSRPIIFFAFFF